VKRRVVTVVVVALLVAGAVLLGRRLLERVPVTIRRGASLEVRRQPRLAFERLLDAGEADVRRVAFAAGAPDALPTPAVLFLDEGAADLSRGLGDQLLDWVVRGGTLVVSPTVEEAGGAVSARLGVRPYEPRHVDDRPTSPRVTVTLPGTRTRFALAPADGFRLDARPAWSAGDGRGGLALALLRRGQGRILIVAGLATMWSNDGIGREDHAALLWTLATTAGSGAPVILTDATTADLTWSAVARRGWPVVTAGAALGLLALWRVLPRMGPVLAPAAPGRRQLREHLQALGRFQVTHARYAALAGSAQRALEQQLRRQPWQRRADDGSALAARPATPMQFLSTIQRLHALWRRLHRA
jgi:hypothetical protein